MREVAMPISIWPEKLIVWDALGLSSIILEWHLDGLEILHQCCKRVKTKSNNLLGTNSNVCGSCRGKSGSRDLAHSAPHPGKG